MLKHSPDEVFMYAQEQAELVEQNEASDEEDLTKSHAKLADVWSAAWSVVRWAKHMDRLLSQWIVYSADCIGSPTDKSNLQESDLYSFVDGMSTLERLTLSSLRGQSVEKDEVASVGQFIGRLLAREKELKQNLGKTNVANNSLPTVFAHFEKRGQLFI